MVRSRASAVNAAPCCTNIGQPLLGGGRRCRQLVVVEKQRNQAGELNDLRWQRRQQVAVEIQRRQTGELPDLRWQRRQQVPNGPQKKG